MEDAEDAIAHARVDEVKSEEEDHRDGVLEVADARALLHRREMTQGEWRNHTTAEHVEDCKKD